MIPLSLFDQIESHQFIADIGVVSTPRRFETVLSELQPVRDLLGYLQTSVERQQLSKHARAILQLPTDERYAHTYDVPLAVYLRALDISAPSEAYALAQAFRQVTNLWWAKFAADKVLSSPLVIQTSDHVLWNPSGVVVRGIGSLPQESLLRKFEGPIAKNTSVTDTAKESTTFPTTVRLHGDDVLARAVATAA